MSVVPNYIEFTNEELVDLSYRLQNSNSIHAKQLAKKIDRSIGQFTTTNLLGSLNSSFEDRICKDLIFFMSINDVAKIDDKEPFKTIALWRLHLGRQR